MQGIKTKISRILIILFMFYIAAGSLNTFAATAVRPKLSMISQPSREYKNGERISFTVSSPNYSGRVQYRVILYNGTTKRTSELWNTQRTGYFYTGWMPSGGTKFPIHWPVSGMEPGAYSLTVLVKKVGSTSPYDSYVKTNTFWVSEGMTTFSAPQPAIMTTSEIIKAYDSSIVEIVSLGSAGEELALGSGFSIGNGLFITNYHVLNIKGVKSYKIITNDNREFDVDGIVKSDEKHDLAIIKSTQIIDLPSVKLGSYKSMEKGDKVIAIGNPYGLQNTVSDGIVSGIRYLSDDDLNLIQITAPITHGSSGGALFNTYGEVVGVTAMGYDEGNLNFAIAIDYTAGWVNELKGVSFSSIPVYAKIIDDSTGTVIGNSTSYNVQNSVNALFLNRIGTSFT